MSRSWLRANGVKGMQRSIAPIALLHSSITPLLLVLKKRGELFEKRDSLLASKNMKSESVSFNRFILWRECVFVKRHALYICVRMFPTPTTPAGFACALGQSC